jgi:SAM-dependent methyltransferase
MAKSAEWEMSPWNQEAVWSKLVGQDKENISETIAQANEIFAQRTGTRCLEIGAGVGRLLKYGRGFLEAWGVDSSVTMVALSTIHLRTWPNVRVVLNDGWRFPFPMNYFNFVYSFTCFQHIETLQMIEENIAEAWRVLIPGGKILIQTVCGKRDTGRHDGHVFESREEFAGLFRGFDEVNVEQRGEWLWLKAKKKLL